MFKEEAPKLNENFIKGNLKDADGNPIEKVEAVA
jgi:hypothetical protein